MELQNAWQLILDMVANDWQVVLLLCGSILALKGVKAVNGGLYSQVANWLGSALASGLFRNLSLNSGLKFVFFSVSSALLYHFINKIAVPAGQKFVADMKAKK